MIVYISKYSPLSELDRFLFSNSNTYNKRFALQDIKYSKQTYKELTTILQVILFTSMYFN